MDAARPRVLVVDDDEGFAQIVAEVLTQKGYDTFSTTDPESAVRHVAEQAVEVAVVDLVMPSIGGIELAGRIKSASPHTQVMILTGQGSIESAIDGIHQGIFDYLSKEAVHFDSLERSVRQAAARSQLEVRTRDLLLGLRESNRLLKALHEAGASLAGEPHIDRLLERLVASAKELCDARYGRALLFERTSGDGSVVALAVGEGAATLKGARLAPGEGIAASVAWGDETILASRPREDRRYCHRCDALPADAADLLCAPLHYGAVHGALTVAGRRSGRFAEDHRELLAGLARQAGVAIENALHRERMVNFFTHTCDLLVTLLDSTDVFYPGHSRRVAALAGMVARRLGMDDVERRNVHFAALLHDIGKLRLDPVVLSSSSSSESQRELIRRHSALGVEILRSITLWEEILPIIHAHHERWDGKGYPSGLAGEEIPLGARVVAVADAFDAMTRETPHGPQRSPEAALAELQACSGTQFDARVVRLFVAEYRERGDPAAAG